MKYLAEIYHILILHSERIIDMLYKKYKWFYFFHSYLNIINNDIESLNFTFRFICYNTNTPYRSSKPLISSQVQY